MFNISGKNWRVGLKVFFSGQWENNTNNNILSLY